MIAVIVIVGGVVAYLGAGLLLDPHCRWFSMNKYHGKDVTDEDLNDYI